MAIFRKLKLGRIAAALHFFKCSTVLSFTAFLLWACNTLPSVSANYQPVYATDTLIKKSTVLFGIYPANNPQNPHVIYRPLIDYLNKKKPDVTFQMASSRSYPEFDKKLLKGDFHFAITNPCQALQAIQQHYGIFAKMSNDEKCKGLIITKKNGPVKTLSDLKHNSISFPAPTAFAATMMPLYFLHSQGLDVNNDIKKLYTISHESSIMSVYLGKTIAGASWSLTWERFKKQNPEFVSKLQVKWETPALVNNACIVRNDVSPELVDKMQALLLSMKNDEQGKKILNNIFISGFETADSDSYKRVAAFVQKYKAVIRE